jgi:hypothetical protein
MTSRCSSHIDELGRSHCRFRHQAPSRTLREVEMIDLRLDKRGEKTTGACIYGFPQPHAGQGLGSGLDRATRPEKM